MKIIIYLIILIFSIQLYAGKIGDFKSTINNDNQSKTSGSGSKSHTNSGHSSSYDSEDEEAAETILAIVGFIFQVVLFGDMEESNFSYYPYYDEHGIYNNDTEEEKYFAGKVTLNYLYSSDLQGIDFSAKLATAYAGLRIDLSHLWEENDFGSEDNITFNNIFLDVYRIRESEITLWWGLGAKGVEGDYAFALDAGIELFLFKPVSLYLNYSAGFFGDFVLQELDTSVNIHMDRYFIKAGYHKHFIDNIELGGFTLGLGGNF